MSAASRRRLAALRTGFERFLEVLVLTLMTSLAVVVVLGVVFRKAGAALVWYDEVASILLAWLTFYGACLAALKRAHIGFPRIVEAGGPNVRTLLLIVRELIVISFFLLTSWTGLLVLRVLGGTYLVSLPWMPAQLTQSVVPISAALFIIADLLVFAETLDNRAAIDLDDEEAVQPRRQNGRGGHSP
ncbi:MAG: TRAP transporter small permease [Acidobacteriota bacterium]